MFYKTIDVELTVRTTFTVSDQYSESLYGVALDALDDTAVRNVECGEDNQNLFDLLQEGDYEIASSKFVVSELMQRDV